MKKLVIIPGGFHPYHAGHKALYDAAAAAFPTADVYVAATADTSARPFPFDVKKKLAKLAGVPEHRFIQVKSPFRAEEITQLYDPNSTQLIFVRSEKDADSQPRPGGTKRDGSLSYLQPYKRNGLEDMTKHGYIAYLPTVQFGPGMTSATEIRAKWPEMEIEQKQNLVNSMYPRTQGNNRLTGVVIKMLDTVMSPTVKEAVLINDPEQGEQIVPSGGMGTWDENSIVRNLARKLHDLAQQLRDRKYRNMYNLIYRQGAMQELARSLAELEGFRRARGKRPVARNAEIDLSDYLDET